MRRVRVMPCLLLRGGGLVKTVRFKKAVYVGDPINTIKLFNEKEVDEIVVLDIDATKERRRPDVRRVRELAGECFMPLAYGGGITSVGEVRDLLAAGAEKVILNTALETHPEVVRAAAQSFGSQSVVASLDVRRGLFGRVRVFTHGGTRNTGRTPLEAARRAVDLGAGEILLNSVDRDGTYRGYDLDLVRSVAAAVRVPVVAVGGARHVGDFLSAVREAEASAVAAGSLFVFRGPHRAVLVNFPDPQTLRTELFSRLGKAS